MRPDGTYDGPEEMGYELQKINPEVYMQNGMSYSEAAQEAVRRYPHLLELINWDPEPEPGIGTRLFGNLKKGPLGVPLPPGATGGHKWPSMWMEEMALNFPGNLLDVGVNFARTVIDPSSVRETAGMVGDLAEGVARKGIRAIGTRDESILGRAIGQTGGPMWSETPPEPVFGQELGAPPSLDPTERVAEAVWDDTAKLIDQEEWIKRPAEQLMRSGLGAIPARVLRFPTVVEALHSMNPILRAWWLAGAKAKPASEAFGVVSTVIPGVMGGVGTEAVAELYRIMRYAPEEDRKKFFTVLNDKNPALHTSATMESMLTHLDAENSRLWRENFPNIQMTSPSNIIHDEVRRAVRRTLRDYDVRGVPDGLDPFDYEKLGFSHASGIQDKADQALVIGWIKSIEQPPITPGKPPPVGIADVFTDEGPRFIKQPSAPPPKIGEYASETGELDVSSFDSMRKGTWKTGENMGMGHKSAQLLMTRGYHEIKEVLIGHIDGYNDLLKQSEKLLTLRKDFADATGVSSGGIMDRKKQHNARIKASRGLINALKSDPNSIMTKALIQEVEELTGVPAMPAAVGTLFNNWVGSGIISRSQLASIGTLLYGAVGGVEVAVLLGLLQMPLVSPKLFAKWPARALGFTQRQWDSVRGVLKSIHDKIPEGWDKDALTFFAAAQQLNTRLQAQKTQDSKRSTFLEGIAAPVPGISPPSIESEP
jgi:hypothetical protein